MIKKILLAVVVLLAGLLGYATTRPAHFVITRQASLPAAPADVFPYLNDMHKWQDWSPWAKLDPACKYTYDGPASGVGAGYAWAGDSKVGEGRMTVTESKPSESVTFALDFIKPMEAKNVCVFTLKPEGAGTHVTWSMSGENGFAGKVFGVIMNMDKLVGADFERGLENLRTVTAAPAKK